MKQPFHKLSIGDTLKKVKREKIYYDRFNFARVSDNTPVWVGGRMYENLSRIRTYLLTYLLYVIGNSILEELEA